MKLTATIPEDHKGTARVDKYLADLHPEYSRAALAKLFTMNLITFRGEAIKPGFKLRPGNTFEYNLGPLQEKPEVIPLPILYEDDDVIVINKPSGIISHARGRFWQEASVASFIRDKVAKTDSDRAGIVHRLDRATSGVMICAKNEATLKHLQQQFHDRKVQKTYIAVVESAPKEPKANIIAPIKRNPDTPKEFQVAPDGKPAETYYEIVGEDSTGAILKLQPRTGRTHQLRVHLRYIGRPIIGDELYGGKQYDRLLLHAHTLEVTMPRGDKKTFTADLPKEMQ